MPKYSKEKQKEHIALVRKIITAKPESSGLQVQRTLDDNGYRFEKSYVYKLLKKIVNERRLRYDSETKSEIIAKFEDFVKGLEPQLRTLSQAGERDFDKINAIKLLVENYKHLINLQMDLGVLERNLGTIKSEGYHFDVVKIAKMIEEVKNKQDKEYARREDNSRGDDQEPEIC